MRKIFNETFLNHIVVRWFLLISGMSMTVLLVNGGINVVLLLISYLIAFIIYFFLLIKNDYVQNYLLKFNRFKIVSAVFSVVFLFYAYKYFLEIFNVQLNKFNYLQTIQTIGLNNVIVLSLTLLAFSFTFILMNLFINGFINICSHIYTSYAITPMKIILISLFIFIAVFFVYNMTSVFYAPYIDNKLCNFDVIFTTDTGTIVDANTYLNVAASENDFRQPLFGVFSAPFAIFAKIISLFFFFIPNIYLIILNSIQVFLLIIVFYLIGELLKLKSVSKIFFMSISFLTFPVLLFSLNMEQYIFSVFWLVLFIFMSLEKVKNNDIILIASTGSLLTSGVLFPLAIEKKCFKEWILDLLKLGLKAITIITIMGRLTILFSVNDKVSLYMGFTGKDVDLTDRIYQFTNFVQSCFVKPETYIHHGEYVSYWLSPITNFNFIGIVIFAFCVLGFIINREYKIVQISFVWILFSIIILCIIGWGTAENGVILYSLYFAWAYIVLVFMCIEKLLKKFTKIKYCIYTALVAVLVIYNLPAMYEIIQFGIEYYPVR